MGIIIIAFLWFVANYEHDSASTDWGFVSDILLRADSDTGPVVWRWKHPPTVTVKVGSAEEIAAVKGAVWEVNQLLSDTNMGVHYSNDSSQGDIEFTFVSRAEFAKHRAVTWEHKELINIKGFWLPNQRERGRLDNASIVVFTNQSEGSKWGTILHELGHSLGLVGHSSHYLSSLYFKNHNGGSISDGFSSDDRKLLRFLYSHLEAGYDEIKTREIFDSYWEFDKTK